jgi:hypothetical protein
MAVKVRRWVRFVPAWSDNETLAEPFAVDVYRCTFEQLHAFMREMDEAKDVDEVIAALSKVIRGPTPAVEVEQQDGSVRALGTVAELVRFGLEEPGQRLTQELMRGFMETNRLTDGAKKNSAPPSGGRPTTEDAPESTAATLPVAAGASTTPPPAATTEAA